MKKILILLIFALTINTSFSYNNYKLTTTDTKTVDKIVKILNKNILTKGEDYKISITEKLNNLIKSEKYNSKINSILEEVNLQINPIVNSEEVEEDFQESSEEIIESETIEDESNTYELENIDIGLIKQNWLSWNNEVRSELGLADYSFNSTLEKSALSWSELSKEKGEITHKRETGDSFYDYTKISNRLSDNGVVCENISGITHTENIRWGGYACTDGECSDELSEATKRAFDNYMAEKGTDSDPHYRSLTQQYFTQIGLGISIDEISENYFEYYLTIHYCTSLVPQE